MEDRVEYNPSPQKRTMTRAEFARAMSGGEDHEARQNLTIAQYSLTGVTETLENAAQDDLLVLAKLIDKSMQDLLAVRDNVLRRLRDDGSTPYRPNLDPTSRRIV